MKIIGGKCVTHEEMCNKLFKELVQTGEIYLKASTIMQYMIDLEKEP